MNNIEIEKKMRELFENNGIIVCEGEEHVQLDIDSLLFTSLVVQIEELFLVEIPDFFLTGQNLMAFCDYCEMVRLIAGD